MKNILISVGLLGLSIFAASAFADGCTNPTSQYDRTYCLGKLFIESDNELNNTYNALRKILPPATKSQLVHAQRNWISFRDATCSSEGEIDVQCNYDVNKTRLSYLQDRLRECKTGHCQTSLIASTDFSAKE